jgi:hypothetical protein
LILVGLLSTKVRALSWDNCDNCPSTCEDQAPALFSYYFDDKFLPGLPPQLPDTGCYLFSQDVTGKLPDRDATQHMMAFPFCKSGQKTGVWHKDVAQVRLEIPLGPWYTMQKLKEEGDMVRRDWSMWNHEGRITYASVEECFICHWRTATNAVPYGHTYSLPQLEGVEIKFPSPYKFAVADIAHLEEQLKGWNVNEEMDEGLKKALAQHFVYLMPKRKVCKQ